ncbi:MAG: branched-chain amino acid ABC transporter permease [Clostridiales bacterium]|nr:branched-chain amino acid ABC transporter permease [Clostridiales bacterium]
MKRTRLYNCNLFRLIVFVVLPLIVLISAGLHPKSYSTALLCTLGINILLAASLNLVNGFSGMFSMGHAAFMAVGAYMSAYLTLAPERKAAMMPGLPEWIVNLQMPFLAGVIFCGLAAAVIALLIGAPVLRFKGHYLSVATLGLIVIVRAVLDNSGKVTNGQRGVTGLPAVSTIPMIYVLLFISLFIMYRLLRSAYGRGLIAMRDDPVAAQTLGVNLTVKKISIFCISAFFAGIAGALWGHKQTVISGQFFYFNQSFSIVQMSIIGGMSSLSGAVIGAAFMTYVPEWLTPLENGGLTLFGTRLPAMFGLSNIVMAAFVVLIIIFRHKGIMGTSEVLTESWFSKDTYLSLFRKSEYQALGRAFVDWLRAVGRFFTRRSGKNAAG